MRIMPKADSRRRFIRRGMELGGGLLAVPALAQTPEAEPTNDTLRTIHSLRTIHGDFSDKQVPDREVKAILGATIRAASASNMQSYSIIVVRDAVTMQKLTGYRGSCLLLYCADYTRTIDVAKHLGHEYHADNMETFITASTNTILAAQTAVIAARSLGVDSLLTNGIHRGDMERIWTLLELPQTSCYPLIALILGYPRTEPALKKGRLSGPAVIHNEKYHRLSKEELEQIVVLCDDKAMQLDASVGFEKRGYKHYLDWFYKEWAGRGRTTGETQMFKRLKKSGFVDLAG